MNIHFIAIGGALMHNLALALHQKGHNITGSDDEIYNPSRSRLAQVGLLPDKMGWDTDRIHQDLDAVIVGMHARLDNPELLAAQNLGLDIYSYPEYLYQQTQQKRRVVIGGSHGKTTTTSMVMHILKYHQIDFDYAVGAALEGFDTMVRLSDAPIFIVEGDEYLSSPLDASPKFWHYNPHIAVLTGIAWDHINVFPDFNIYKKVFKKFIKKMGKESVLIHYRHDEYLTKYAKHAKGQAYAYQAPNHKIQAGKTYLDCSISGQANRLIPLSIFGQHNLENFQAARLVCRELGLNDAQIIDAIRTFKGASKRLQKLAENDKTVVYSDFAHAPSKVKATINAVKKQYPDYRLVALLELHTYSSLNPEFLPEYRGIMEEADDAWVYYSPHTLEIKKLPPLLEEDIKNIGIHPYTRVYSDTTTLQADLDEAACQQTVFLFMSSGKWGGIDVQAWAEQATL